MKHFFLPILLFALLSACGQSGDGLIKKLSRDSGTWTITEIVWQIVEQDIPNQNIYNGTETGGTFKFDNGGNLVYDYSINGIARSGNAVWSVNDTEVQISYIDLNGVPSGALTVTYTVVHNGRNDIKLQGIETYTDANQRTITNNMSITLERRN
jgi:hypothetical protein